MDSIDWTIVRTAATGGLIIIVPGAILAGVAFDDAPRPVVWFFLALVLLGFAVSGYIAGRLRLDTPIAHGVISALVAFLVAQGFGIASNLARGDEISWVAIPLTAILAAAMGVAGGLLSDVAHRRAARAG